MAAVATSEASGPAQPEAAAAEPPQETSRERSYVIADSIWSDFSQRSTPYRRRVRTTAMAGAYMAAWLLAGFVVGFPQTPYRGGFSSLCDCLALGAGSIALTYLMFWVVDETQLCLRVVEKLGRIEPTIWPECAYDLMPTFKPVHARDGIRHNEASSYIEVCFIGQLTKEAVPLIILPFVVLTLMILARWTYFANWRWEPLVIAIFAFDGAACVVCAVKLRNAAVAAKDRALRRISQAIAVARAAKESDRADGLEVLRSLMEDNSEGAFKPWHQQPFVSAVLLPFGGSGGLGLIEYLLSR